ncbi:DUF1499 domain-containing protein [Roseomonas sp. M0104]|uniref:DUF1499 domain-containing protein n=1 Tax=Teichococcus coralli TaxID=2545983 RepID=A0A845B3I3_9PROT|nr:DUF1499 domain-containing protein [Pseudoroseomonas coralli]MXP61761.1 DUF1499 domain-containing protein [Pseudoroseomonas coralli]
MRHSVPFRALLGRGAHRLPAPQPIAFDATFRLPPSPNAALAAPAGSALPAHRRLEPYRLAPTALMAALRRVATKRARCSLLAEWPEREQVQWVERTRWTNFPDIIAAQVLPDPAGAALVLYSRSLFGWSDLGVNGRRVAAWLAALDAELRAG